MNDSDARTVAVLMAIIIVMILAYLSLLLTVLLLASIALFLIGWYLTHVLFTTLDQMSEERIIAEHGGALLILAGLLWSVVLWFLTPPLWVSLTIILIPRLAPYPYFPAIIGGVLGLAWGMLVLFTADREQEAQMQDAFGMNVLTMSQIQDGDPETLDILDDGVVLGTDVDF